MAIEHRLEVVPVGVGHSSYEYLAQFTNDGKVLVTEDFSVFEFLFESLPISVSSSASTEGAGSFSTSLVDEMITFAQDEGVVGVQIKALS